MSAARNRLTALVSACALAILQLTPQSGQAQELDADSYLYAGFGMMAGSYRATDVNVAALKIRFLTDAETTGLYGRLGYQLNPNLAIEGRLGYGLGTDEFATTVTLGGAFGIPLTGPANLETQLTRFFGFYGRFGNQVGAIYLYGMVGLSQINTTRKFLDTELYYDRSTFEFPLDTNLRYNSDFGLSGAFGVDVPFSDSLTGTLEIFAYSMDDQDSLTGLNFSLTWSF